MAKAFVKPKWPIVPRSRPSPRPGLRTWQYFVFAILITISCLAYPVKTFFAVIDPPQPIDQISTPCSTLSEDSNSGVLGHVFNLDLVFGNLSFSVAKFVDSIWDVGFGRGTQAIMVWVTYHALMQSLNWIMESRPVPYKSFVSATMSPVDITTIGPLSHLVVAGFTVEQKCLAAWLILAISWLVIFPTIASAMTGYINRVDPRIDALVMLHEPGVFMNLTEFSNLSHDAYQYTNECDVLLSELPPSSLGIDNETIITQYGPEFVLWNALYNLSHHTAFYSRSSPILYYPNISSDAGACFIGLRYVSNEIYPWNYTDSLENVLCLQGSDYQWGFSSTLIIVFLICNTIWLIGMFITLESVSRQSQFVKKRRQMGKYRAAVDLAEIIKKELGPNLSAFSDSDLETELKTRPPIRYHVLQQSGHLGERHEHIGLSSDNPNSHQVLLEYEKEYV